mgnify:FL=1|jgi:hypothetical protein
MKEMEIFALLGIIIGILVATSLSLTFNSGEASGFLIVFLFGGIGLTLGGIVEAITIKNIQKGGK